MMNMKKAQGFGLQTIAIAVIVLIVVVVLLAIFTDVLDDVIPSIKIQATCEGRGGSCASKGSCPAGNAEIFGLGCQDNEDEKYCCIPE